MIEIIRTGDFFDEALAAAQDHCARTGALFLSPFDDPDVIEGQATVAVELLDALPQAPDRVILPVGGGGLSSGVSRYLAAEAPSTRITLTEPAGAPSLRTALEHGRNTTIPITDGFVDGATVARIGDHPFTALRHFSSDDVLIAPEGRLCITIDTMLNIEGIVLEPAGALAIDALTALGTEIKGETVVCVTSGGNFDFARLPDVQERARKWRGLKKYYLLRLPQRPGALRDFLDLLGPDDDITRFEYLKKSSRNFGSVLIGIEGSAAAEFAAMEARVEARGFGLRDITEDQVLSDLII